MEKLKALKLINSWPEENGLISDFIKEKFSGAGTLKILEAGCGQKWPLDLEQLSYNLTGVDLDRESLEIRKKLKKDLDDIVWGDLRTISLKDNEYDLIYSSYVLEHIKGAEIVMDNFLKWLKTGGIIVLKIPDRDTVFGFLARITPFWFHVLYKRHIEKVPNAGKEGYDPYPTTYDKLISRKGIHRYCKNRRLAIRLEFGTNSYLINFKKFSKSVMLLTRVMKWMSFGKLKSNHNNLILILEKY